MKGRPPALWTGKGIKEGPSPRLRSGCPSSTVSNSVVPEWSLCNGSVQAPSDARRSLESSRGGLLLDARRSVRLRTRLNRGGQRHEVGLSDPWNRPNGRSPFRPAGSFAGRLSSPSGSTMTAPGVVDKDIDMASSEPIHFYPYCGTRLPFGQWPREDDVFSNGPASLCIWSSRSWMIDVTEYSTLLSAILFDPLERTWLPADRTRTARPERRRARTSDSRPTTHLECSVLTYCLYRPSA